MGLTIFIDAFCVKECIIVLMGLKRTIWILVIFVSVLVTAVFILPAFNSTLWKWPKLGGEFNDVDINTGRIRHIHYLLYYKTSEKIQDSILTRMIGQFPNDIQPDWQRVNTIPRIGRKYSPHYVYHGAISQIRSVEVIWQLRPFSDEAKKHMAQAILGRWQLDGNDFGAGRYINDVWNAAIEKTESDPNAIVLLDDLITIHNEQ